MEDEEREMNEMKDKEGIKIIWRLKRMEMKEGFENETEYAEENE